MGESYGHFMVKHVAAVFLHQLGFKVDTEAWVNVKGNEYRLDVCAVKDGVAIIVEVGQLQKRSVKFMELFQAIKSKYHVNHVIFCNPLEGDIGIFQVNPELLMDLREEMKKRTKPSRVLHIREHP